MKEILFKENLNSYKKELWKEFGLLFKKLREDNNYTQQTFAELLGWQNSQSVANIESGNVPFPVEKTKALCKIVKGVTPEQIVDAILEIEKKVLLSRAYNKIIK